jgi:putative nucleotidyltransferase with HDIG domain
MTQGGPWGVDTGDVTALAGDDPLVEDLLRDGAHRHERPLASRRERVVEYGAATALVLVSALLLFAEPAGAYGLASALPLTLLFAAASRVRFTVGAGDTSAAQLVVVPMLLLLPPGAVPLLVAAGYLAGMVPELAAGRLHRDRLVLAVADAWFAMGPAIVLVAAGAPGPDLALWWLYVIAFAAQIAADVGSGIAREWLASGTSPGLQLRVFGLVVAVDASLAPVGFLAGIVAADHPAALLLVVPLGWLLALFAHERERRIEHALALSEAYRGSSLLMGEMLEADDPYTGGEHSKGVVALALEVGRELRLDAREQRNLEFGALLHDIGKLKVPDEILNKPGKLTPAEWEVIKRHPEDGQKMLDRIGGVLAEVGLTVRAHHERWDGGGYPDGLVGEAIPLNARIITACDSYSAMTTNRSYRRAMPREEAVAELGRCAGTQFDPRVVEAVVTVVEREAPVRLAARLAA